MMQGDYMKWMERAKRLRNFIKTMYCEDWDEAVEEAYGRCILTPNDVLFLNGIDELCEPKCPYHKPPLGIMPRDMWERERQKELVEAMTRYLEVNKRIPKEWMEEYNEISDRWKVKDE